VCTKLAKIIKEEKKQIKRARISPRRVRAVNNVNSRLILGNSIEGGN
jgi:hypothetical protein